MKRQPEMVEGPEDLEEVQGSDEKHLVGSSFQDSTANQGKGQESGQRSEAESKAV